MNATGWKDIPIGGWITEPATAMTYRTGGWRIERPVRDESTCTNCLQCWLHCPDSSIRVKEGEMTGFDYDHCKGCGICVSVCPVKCISMQKEE
jgi:pyruvate ferredoxin oxidoreductase delta subunit